MLTLAVAAAQSGDTVRNWISGASAVIALIALGVTLTNYRRSQDRDRRDLFLSVHRALIEPDVASGRRHLYRAKSQISAEGTAIDETASGEIYRALAMLDLLALYVESGWIDYDTVKKEWSYSLVNTRPGANLWIAERYRDREQEHSWEHYHRLAERVAKERARG